MNVEMMKTGFRFSRLLTLSSHTIREFAKISGDTNPIHFSPDCARKLGFNDLVVSGPQTSALMMGLSADHFSKLGSMLGLDFQFRFKHPVYRSETIKLEWLIVRVSRNQKLGGHVIEMRGRIQNSKGVTAVGAKGLVLVKDED